ncbi:uncharacterized protein E0L32_004980 [Thyridium curvatum]|uniref:Aminoglycoside phosphotransferase domain-containing protein n=1 Tax=Thyridium curvatum TaxID=1093900 RepID=A0A507BD27_9PEZI|nr:uncharacterized protein E0L32_004980 [Thyridium curvatum]TPX14871.1 hypothetical protein E0L32_004980 [Thyridium curvatum]
MDEVANTSTPCQTKPGDTTVDEVANTSPPPSQTDTSDTTVDEVANTSPTPRQTDTSDTTVDEVANASPPTSQTDTSAAVAEPEPTLSLLGKPPITYRAALDTDDNYISEAAFVRATEQLFQALWAQQPAIKGLVRHHLGLRDRDDVVCDIAGHRRWLVGGFNVCIPVRVTSPTRNHRLILRCAMPHKLAESRFPGTVDEKTACEVGAYVWMQEKCPDIPIPRLYGFGFSDRRCFTHQDYRPWYVRAKHRLRRLLRGFLRSLCDAFRACPTDSRETLVTSRYICHPDVAASHQLPSAYMLLENVNSKDSQMLAHTWTAQRKDPVRQQNLFCGLARIMLSLARVPLPRIGALRFRDDGTVALANRPLDCTMMLFENDGTPRVIPRDRTYATTEAYVADLFRLHDQRFLSHPNATYEEEDCRRQMAAWVLARSLAYRFIRQDQRDGPFSLQLTDLRPQNIFVDNTWNVTSLVDLEWVCALPVERLCVPYWLTGQDIGELHGEPLAEYTEVWKVFMAAFEQEESRMALAKQHNLSFGKILEESWTSGTLWFWRGLASVNAMPELFEQHLRPRFSPDVLYSEEKAISSFWREDADEVVQIKLDAYQGYARDLKELFGRT